MEKGIYFIASGEGHVKEATEAAKQCKSKMRDLGIALCSNLKPVDSCFDFHIPMEDPSFSFGDKPSNIARSPFERTLFLDSDVYVLSDVSGLFEILERFEFAAVPAELRTSWHKPHLPDCFTEVNSGVLLYKKCEATHQLFDAWNHYFSTDLKSREGGWCPDQPSLREALFNTPVAFAALPPEYNFRFPYPVSADGEVKILHGRSDDYPTVEMVVNSSDKMRVVFGDYCVPVTEQQPLKKILKQRLKRFFGK